MNAESGTAVELGPDTTPEEEEKAVTPTESRPTDGLARRIVVVTALGALAFAALSIYGDVRELGRTLASLDVRYFLGALALASTNYALRFLRWEYYLRCVNVRVPTGRSARIFLAGFVMSVTPGKVGEVFKSWLLYETDGVPIATTAPVVLAERLTDLIALVALAGAGSLAFPAGRPAAVAGAIVVINIWALATIPALGDLALRVCAKLPVLSRITPKLEEALVSLRAMIRPAPLLATSALAIVSWGLECVALFVLVMGLPGAHVSLEGAVFAYSAPTIAGAVMMTPGGLGVTELGMAGGLITVGAGSISPAAASAATILIRLATLWWAVLLGAIALAAYRRIDSKQKEKPTK